MTMPTAGCSAAALFYLGMAGLAPASAQTFEEAAYANVGLALQLCLSDHCDMAIWSNQFRAAGFSERIERSTVNNDTTHYFTTPADTAQIELYYGEMPAHCIVSTVQLGVTEAAGVLDAIVPRLYPGYFRKMFLGATDPKTGQPAQCVSYEDPTKEVGHVVVVAPASDGTSKFYSSYRV